jgi:hypothetical protein
MMTIDFDEPSIQINSTDARKQRQLRTKSMAALQIQGDQHTPLTTIKAPAFEALYAQLKKDFQQDAVVAQLLESAASDVEVGCIRHLDVLFPPTFVVTSRHSTD